MKNTPSNRWLILASPQGYLTAKRADHFRRFPDDYTITWQRLTYVRADDFQAVKETVYGWAIWMYRL